jgi:hypothetical protein
MADTNLKVCPQCGVSFAPFQGRMTCSSECAKLRRKAYYKERDRARTLGLHKPTAPQQVAGDCANCGKRFERLWTGGPKPTTCGKACHDRTWAARSGYKKKKPSKVRYNWPRPPSYCKDCSCKIHHTSQRCGACVAKRQLVRATEYQRGKKPLVERVCKECQSLFTPEYGNGRRIFCSSACSCRHSNRINRAKRDAALRGVKVEAVNPIRVFERDAWRCYLCGIGTPRHKRGTYEPDAPELEHVIPISRGGEHSYANTACSCRACNAAKGDMTVEEFKRLAA